MFVTIVPIVLVIVQ